MSKPRSNGFGCMTMLAALCMMSSSDGGVQAAGLLFLIVSVVNS